MSGLPWCGPDSRGIETGMAVHIDTLEYARLLREAGLTGEQADGQARALGAVMTDSLATKQDLEALEVRTGGRFNDVDAQFVKIDARFEAIDARFEAIDAKFEAVDARFEAVDARLDHLERQMDTRFSEQDRRIEMRLSEFAARFDGRLSDLERRLTWRVVASIGVVSALVRIL